MKFGGDMNHFILHGMKYCCNEQTCVSNKIRKKNNQLLSDYEDVSLVHHQHSSAKPDKTISSILKPRRRSDRLSKQVIR